MLRKLLLAAALVLPAGAAYAQAPICGPQDEIFAVLEGTFDEVPVAAGLMEGDRIAVLTKTLNGETWSLVVISQDGRACLVTGGGGWTTIKTGENA